LGENVNKTKQNTHQTRGFWLSLILIVMALHGIFGTVLYYTIRTQEALEKPWIISLMALHSLANIIAVVGIWFWKKWALYIYAASTVLALFVGLISLGGWSVFYMILPLAILGWILRAKWDLFK